MGKLLPAAVAGVALLVYAFHSHGASAAKVGSCLSKRGATVERSRLLEEGFGLTAEGQQVPEGLKRELEDAEKHLYDMTMGPDSGLLMDTTRPHREAQLTAAAAANGLDITPQGHGKVVMIWYGGPTATSRSTLERCF